MNYPLLSVVLSAGLLLLAILVSGCGATVGDVVKGGTVVAVASAKCEPATQADVETAIRGGGANWLAVVVDGIECAWSVYQGLKSAGLVALDNHGELHLLGTQLLADGDIGSPGMTPLSKRAVKRLGVALKLRSVMLGQQ